MSGITTHVLDTSTGRPAAGIAVRLSRDGADVASGVTDDDGRWAGLPGDQTEPGTYRLTFDTGSHFRGVSFHPQVVVEFAVRDTGEHHHVPLLVSAFGYTTYRGS